MKRPPSPDLECWTCKHREKVEHGACLAVGIVEHRCREFRHDLFGDATPMNCSKAYDDFCFGRCYAPNLRLRVFKWWFGLFE